MSINGKNEPCLTRFGPVPDVMLEYTLTGPQDMGGDPCKTAQIIFWTVPVHPNLEPQQYRGKAT